jgi:hypothetical protein
MQKVPIEITDILNGIFYRINTEITRIVYRDGDFQICTTKTLGSDDIESL